MKRILGVIVFIGLLLLVWMQWGASEPLLFKKESSQKLVEEKQITVLKSQSKAVDSEQEVLPAADTEALVSHEIQYENCKELNAAYPNAEHEFNALMDEIFSSAEEAASTGPFSTMDGQSLENLAKGGDKDAMFYHGSNLIWLGADGLKIYGHENEVTVSSTENKANKIKPELIREGEELLYQAALKGKFGGMLELKISKQLVSRKYIQTQPDAEAEILVQLADYMAYTLALAVLHKNDGIFVEYFINGAETYDKDFIKMSIKNWKPGLSNEKRETLVRLVLDNAENKSKAIIEKWIEDREYLGEEPFPKLFGRELEYYSSLCLGNNGE